jgi:glycosyltransferase involved in cell wall biosynthesis
MNFASQHFVIIRRLNLLSVVIATYNSAQTIHHTLSSIFLNDYPNDLFEVIVVDGGSIDNTTSISNKFPVRIYSCPNTSVGFRRNLSIKESKGEIICCTDADIIVPKDWLRKISDYFHKHPKVGGIGGPLLPPHDSQNEIQKYTGELYFEDQDFPERSTKIETLEYRTLLPTANSAFRKDVLVCVGGFPEDSFLGTIDMPLMWKLVSKGHRLMFLPDLQVIHLGFPITLSGVFRQQFKWGKNKGILKRKYLSPPPKGIIDDLKGKAYPYFQVTKAFFRCISPIHRPKKKELLRFCHYTSYYFASIYGQGIRLKNGIQQRLY